MKPELVFKALADVNRRKLLDLLFLSDGRSLTDLESHLPMTRFGVMKHLRVLKDAGLVSTGKSGRETLHFLNPIPIQMVYDRWVSKYSKGWSRSLTELKYDLEETTMAEAARVEITKQLFEIYIKTTPESLWRAITEGELTKKYYFNTSVESEWKNGSEYRYKTSDGFNMLDGKVIESDPPRKLVTTFNPHWMPEVEGKFPESQVSYEIEAVGDLCKLTLIHEGLLAESAMTEGIFRGWSQILSSLKSLLETGKALTIEA